MLGKSWKPPAVPNSCKACVNVQIRGRKSKLNFLIRELRLAFSGFVVATLFCPVKKKSIRLASGPVGWYILC